MFWAAAKEVVVIGRWDVGRGGEGEEQGLVEEERMLS